MLLALADKLARRLPRWRPAAADAAGEALLDEAALRELARLAQALPWSLLQFRQHTTHPLIGETPSPQRGQGLEFEENRPYQAGDPSRLLNWRAFARSGELSTKVFAEERRPQLFLLLDRRAGMRFGTRRQLKAALAAKIAACYAYQAQAQALSVGGVVLEQTTEWFAPAQGENALQTLIAALAAPCPPLEFECAQPGLEASLRLLLHRLPPGCLVLVLSDFADLDPDSALPLLSELASRHTVQAIQILDPVERRLPTAGDFLIDDPASRRPLRIDSRNALQQTLYAEAADDGNARLRACLDSCGIAFRSCTTEDDLEACLGSPDAAYDAP